MPTLIVGTNTYQNLSQANAYFENRLYTTVWDVSSDDFKSKGLLMAMQKMSNWKYPGQKNESDQALPYPRKNTGIEGVKDNVVPNAMLYGQCEMALAIMTVNTVNADSNSSAIVSSKFGDSEIQYDRSSTVPSDPFAYAKEIMDGYFDPSISVIR